MASPFDCRDDGILVAPSRTMADTGKDGFTIGEASDVATTVLAAPRSRMAVFGSTAPREAGIGDGAGSPTGMLKRSRPAASVARIVAGRAAIALASRTAWSPLIDVVAIRRNLLALPQRKLRATNHARQPIVPTDSFFVARESCQLDPAK
ncbi:hypothetical protein [Methylobacterium sp. 10]|uniref:hypothetical protein n=1 Tax=Methylobacterium sp. 10 TaxID=1101191 RepID=UPI000485A48D|nr:hypothetical protein [Methylobacterium sp. 10]